MSQVESDPFDDCLGVHVQANAKRFQSVARIEDATPAETGQGVVAELQALADEVDRRHLRGAVKASDDFADRLIAGLRNAIALAHPTPDTGLLSELVEAASKLIAAFDELQSTTSTERIITGRSDQAIRKASNEAIADIRTALAKVKAGESDRA